MRRRGRYAALARSSHRLRRSWRERPVREPLGCAARLERLPMTRVCLSEKTHRATRQTSRWRAPLGDSWESRARSPSQPWLEREGVRACPATCARSEEHTSELQSLRHLVCRLLLEKKKNKINQK